MASGVYKSIESKQAVMDLYDRELKKWPVPYTTRVVPTTFGDTLLIECGDGTKPPLFLIHGASSNALTWAGDVSHYTDRYHVFVVDVIGEPGKSAETRPPIKGDSYAAWLYDVVTKLGLKKITLIGMSQGGYIALQFSVHHPEMVQSLILLAPGGVVPTKPSFLLVAILSMLFGKRGSHMLNSYVFGPVSVDPIVLSFMDTIMNATNPRMDPEYIYTDDELRKLTMPVLLIGGMKDVIRPEPEIKSRLTSLLPTVTAVLLRDAGHVLINTSSHVHDFLSQRT
jgi:pimeloyl-ACP methyl ester carboxylesterase